MIERSLYEQALDRAATAIEEPPREAPDESVVIQRAQQALSLDWSRRNIED